MEESPVDTDSEEEGPTVSADPYGMLQSLSLLSKTQADPEAMLLLLSSITIKNANGTPDSPKRKRTSDTNDDKDKENKRGRQESQDTPNKTKRQSNEAGSSGDKEKKDHLKCYICNYIYKTEWRFSSHLKSHPDLCGVVILPGENRRFCCALCGNTYSNKANVKRHIHRKHKINNLKFDSKDSRESKCDKKDFKVNKELDGKTGNSQSNNEGSKDSAKEPTKQPEVRNELSGSQKERPVILENRPVTIFCRECGTYIVHTVFKAHQEQHKMNYDEILHESCSEIIEEVPQEQNNNEMCNVPNNAQEGVVSRDESTVDQTNNSQCSTVEEVNEQGDQEETYATYDVHDGNTVSTSGFDNHFSEEMDKDLKKELKKLFSIYDNEIIEISDDSDGENNITEPNSTPSLRKSSDLNDILKNGKDDDNAKTDDVVAPANAASNEQCSIETTSNGNNVDSAKIDDAVPLAHEANNDTSKEARFIENDDDKAVIGDIITIDDEGNNEEQPKAANSKGNNDGPAKIDSVIAPVNENKNKEQLKEANSNEKYDDNAANAHRTTLECEADNEELKEARYNGNAKTDNMIAANEPSNEEQPKINYSNGNRDDSIDNTQTDDKLITATERNIQPDKSNSASNVILPSTSDLDIGEENEEGVHNNELQLLIEEERRIKDILSRRDDGTEG